MTVTCGWADIGTATRLPITFTRMSAIGDDHLDSDALLGALTLEEKAGLCSGSGFWHTRAVERLGIPSILLSDGPHGLRIQVDGGDHLGLDASLPATCFPPATTLASTWDVALVGQVGDAIGAEARANGLAVVLGPGVNIKRSPLCGRNFEYFSEDPVVSALLGAAWVLGVQARGVGASLKHFAVNNQETDRLRVSAEVDQRTLHELYLAAFERIVALAAPWTVMCSYNRINGVLASQDPWLLTEVLRDSWGFEGLVVSDWGAVADPVAAVRAGLDLEMPSTGGASARVIADAVRNGELAEEAVDRAVRRVLELVALTQPGVAAPGTFSIDAHHQLARNVAASGIVLLRNDDDTLPLALSSGQRLAVIGAFAQTPRYQGAGSSQVNPTRVDDALGELRAGVPAGVDVDFAPGFTIPTEPFTTATSSQQADDRPLLAEAVACARDADAVVLFLGLPAAEESEGFDRTHLDLPADQIAVLEAVAAVADNVVVVLSNGGVVSTHAIEPHAAALVEAWLGGQAGGGAIADVLLGEVCPSGKLAETIPRRLQDTPSFHNFPGENRSVRYGEGLFVGYRHYDAIDGDVAYPFGHGLSYTTFSYRDLSVVALPQFGGPDVVEVGATVRNTGNVAGSEVVQLYVEALDPTSHRPVRELKAFTKVHLEPDESQVVVFRLTRRDLSTWSPRIGGWAFAPGRYEISLSASSRDHRLVGEVNVSGTAPTPPLDRSSTLAEWLDHPVGRDRLLDALRSARGGDLSSLLDDAATLRMIGPFPLTRLLAMMEGAFPDDALETLLDGVARDAGGGEQVFDARQTGWESDAPEDRPT